MNITLYIFLLIELSLISYIDIKFKRIPNLFVLFNIFLYLVLLFINPDIYHFSFSSLLFSITFFFVGFLLFLLNIMGGGDSKYLASLFLLVSESQQEAFFLSLLIMTIVVGGSLLLKNSFTKRIVLFEIISQQSWGRLKEVYGTKFSFAPVILLSMILYGIMNLWK